MMSFFTKLLTPVFIALGMVNPTPIVETSIPETQVQQELIELRQKVQELETGKTTEEMKEDQTGVVADAEIQVPETKAVEVKKEILVEDYQIKKDDESEQIDLLLDEYVLDKWVPFLEKRRDLLSGLAKDIEDSIQRIDGELDFMNKTFNETDKIYTKQTFKDRSLIQYNYQVSVAESKRDYVNSIIEIIDGVIETKDPNTMRSDYDEIVSSYDSGKILQLINSTRSGDASKMLNISSFYFLGSSFFNYSCSTNCSGHEAGYSWAFMNNISSDLNCDGNSQSFIEGCVAYTKDKLFK
jgi:hypothetical protein